METQLVHITLSQLEIMTARHLLHEAGIQTFVMNKSDSVYPGIFDGKIQLFVGKDQATVAKKILADNDFKLTE